MKCKLFNILYIPRIPFDWIWRVDWKFPSFNFFTVDRNPFTYTVWVSTTYVFNMIYKQTTCQNLGLISLSDTYACCANILNSFRSRCHRIVCFKLITLHTAKISLILQTVLTFRCLLMKQFFYNVCAVRFNFCKMNNNFVKYKGKHHKKI